jgi:diguanylate cyclase (GGDEF)-like protein/PAS domain S-box-containing protein
MTPNRFLQIVDAIPESFMLIDSEGRILSVNRHAAEFLGIDRHHSGANIGDLVSTPSEKLEAWLRIWSRSQAPVPFRLAWKNLDPETQSRLLCQAFVLEPGTRNRLARIVLRCVAGRSVASRFVELNREIDRQKTVLEKLKHSREALEAEIERAKVTLRSIGDAVITTDKRGRIDFLNPVAEKLTGWLNTDATGRPVAEVFRIVNELTREPADDPVEYCLLRERTVGLAHNTVLISRDGTDYVIEDSAAPIRNNDGEIVGVVLVFRDVTGERLAHRQLEYLAQHDTLTGLKNRFYFEQQLGRVVDVAARGRHGCALLYLDLDRFKLVNDTAGHAAGDQLLIEIAAMLAERLRQGDVLARLGGDEFGIILDNVRDDQLYDIAGKFSRALSNSLFQWEGNDYNITCSVGVAMIDERTLSSAEAMRQADIACYAAKDAGRNRFHIYSGTEKENSTSMLGELSMVRSLTRAMAEDGFTLLFQPIMNLHTRAIDSHEALLRLRNENSSLIRPMKFIQVAERNGMMPEIDKWVLGKTLDLLRDAEYARQLGMLTVNLSGQSIGDPEILEMIADFARVCPQQAGQLSLEITETAAVTHLDRASLFINELRSLGVRFALDDFGTGFSSFAYLKHLQVDYIKIDGTFIRDVVNDPVDNAMVRSMNQIAHSLNKNTVAEFVESEEILDMLQEIGVDNVQGYYIGKPAERPGASAMHG